MVEKKDTEKKGNPKDHTESKEAEKIKHGLTSKDETGAPKGKNRSNAGEETS